MSAAKSGSRSAAKPRERRRAYRYTVTDSWGSGVAAIGDSPFVIDWQYLGLSYTWHIYNLTTMEIEGWIAGKYVDKGYTIKGQFKSDEELAAAS
jgi:hypothetical protein